MLKGSAPHGWNTTATGSLFCWMSLCGTVGISSGCVVLMGPAWPWGKKQPPESLPHWAMEIHCVLGREQRVVF